MKFVIAVFLLFAVLALGLEHSYQNQAAAQAPSAPRAWRSIKPAPDPIIDNWNACVDTFKQEFPNDGDWGLWQQLHDSLEHDPPSHVRSLDRISIEDRLIQLTQQRLNALRTMKRTEEGK